MRDGTCTSGSNAAASIGQIRDGIGNRPMPIQAYGLQLPLPTHAKVTGAEVGGSSSVAQFGPPAQATLGVPVCSVAAGSAGWLVVDSPVVCSVAQLGPLAQAVTTGASLLASLFQSQPKAGVNAVPIPKAATSRKVFMTPYPSVNR
jgi:hypothetical protein